MKTWLKGICISVYIWIILMLLWSLLFIIKHGGKCPFWDEPNSFINCFAPATILTIYAIIPVIILGLIIGLIIQKVRK